MNYLLVSCYLPGSQLTRSCDPQDFTALPALAVALAAGKRVQTTTAAGLPTVAGGVGFEIALGSSTAAAPLEPIPEELLQRRAHLLLQLRLLLWPNAMVVSSPTFTLSSPASTASIRHHRSFLWRGGDNVELVSGICVAPRVSSRGTIYRVLELTVESLR